MIDDTGGELIRCTDFTPMPHPRVDIYDRRYLQLCRKWSCYIFTSMNGVDFHS